MSGSRPLPTVTLGLLSLSLLLCHAHACSCFPSPLDDRVCTSALSVRAAVLLETDTCGATRSCNATSSMEDQVDGRRVYITRVVETFHGTPPKDELPASTVYEKWYFRGRYKNLNLGALTAGS